MALRDVLRGREGELAERWLAAILASYPADAADFLRRERDEFANPVGQTLARETRAILRALLGDGTGPGGAHAGAELRARLEPIVKIRSIQGLGAAQAVSLFYQLKTAVRGVLDPELGDARMLHELLELELEIDTLALWAFDIFMGCRDRLCEIRVNELKRSVHALLRRASGDADDSVSLP